MKLVALSTIGFLAMTGVVCAEEGKSVSDRLDSAHSVLVDMTKMSDKGIPTDLIQKAQCIVVVPGLKKGGFIVGAKYGKGFLSCRKKSGAGWTAPGSVRIEGGSFGLQIGASAVDIILLVMNEAGEKKLLSSKFTIGGEASAAAGPVGRDTSAQTDAAMTAEILSYSRSRGIFGGISLQGATLRQDLDDNAGLYGKQITNQEIANGAVKPSAPYGVNFVTTLNHLSKVKKS